MLPRWRHTEHQILAKRVLSFANIYICIRPNKAIRAGAKRHGCTQRAGRARPARTGVRDSPTQGLGHEDEAQEWVLPSQARLGLVGPRSLPGLQERCALGQNLDFATYIVVKAAGLVQEPWNAVLLHAPK